MFGETKKISGGGAVRCIYWLDVLLFIRVDRPVIVVLDVLLWQFYP